jgi:hypothetical protein
MRERVIEVIDHVILYYIILDITRYHVSAYIRLACSACVLSISQPITTSPMPEMMATFPIDGPLKYAHLPS